MASRCCREGPGVGWRGGIFLCALQHVRCVPPKHVPFSARRSCCSQTGQFLGKLLARVCMDVRSRAPGCGHGGVPERGWEALDGSACTVEVHTQEVLFGGVGGVAGRSVYSWVATYSPPPPHPIHSTAAAALSHGYWTSFFVLDP